MSSEGVRGEQQGQLIHSVANSRLGRQGNKKTKIIIIIKMALRGELGGWGVYSHYIPAPTCAGAGRFISVGSTMWDSAWILHRRSLSSELWAKAWKNNQRKHCLEHRANQQLSLTNSISEMCFLLSLTVSKSVCKHAIQHHVYMFYRCRHQTGSHESPNYITHPLQTLCEVE